MAPEASFSSCLIVGDDREEDALGWVEGFGLVMVVERGIEDWGGRKNVCWRRQKDDAKTEDA